ncbi:stalk domain-containing protein [Paenibacillus sp. OV219]|uniref:RCC1 domain-containing protein n=1 Tax=Paenibacillus sp. OV219 TaxID=1884377 RepID=UPI0008C533F8|nr:stalk domain-containing protein [Paenibacillus sp. OV219]SEN94699.1 Alpha-tubulin suppressor [Paenibacillus sp. OV219]
MSLYNYNLRSILLVIAIFFLMIPVVVEANESGSNLVVQADDSRYLVATQIEAGAESAFAIAKDGTVWGWGGGYGALGHGATTPAFLPVRIHIDHVRQISSGYRHTLFLKEDGTVWAVGGNEHGQLGNGQISNGEKLFTEPMQILGLSDVIHIAAGDNHSLAVKSDGTVWAWGGNEHGQLGDDTRENRLNPRLVVGMPKMKSVAAGQYTSIVLSEEGDVWVWGLQAYNVNDIQHGFIRKPTPMSGNNKYQAIAADSTLGAALDSYGAVWVWENYSGSSWKAESKLQPQRILNMNNIVSFTVHSAVDSKGNAWKWKIATGKYLELNALPVPVNQAQAITEGSRNIYVLMNDGSIYSKGFNQFGQLGQGTLDFEVGSFKPIRKAASIILNGNSIEPTVPPLILNGVTYIPLRGVLEAMGVNIRWDIASRSVIADKGNKHIVFNTISGKTEVDGKTVNLDKKPVYAHDSLLVPLRFVSETVGAKVVWNSAEYTVEINTVSR